MFMLHSSPAASNITFEEHAARLFKSWVLNWLAKYKMLKEVHLLFDEFDNTGGAWMGVNRITN